MCDINNRQTFNSCPYLPHNTWYVFASTDQIAWDKLSDTAKSTILKRHPMTSQRPTNLTGSTTKSPGRPHGPTTPSRHHTSRKAHLHHFKGFYAAYQLFSEGSKEINTSLSLKLMKCR